MKVLLHLEGAAVLAGAIWVYFGTLNAHSAPFVVLLLAPDLGMVGYLGGTRQGAACYNATHTYLLPAVLLAAGALLDIEVLAALAMVGAAHIGMDRMLGYGLKYPSAFRDTHLQRVGDAPPTSVEAEAAH